MSCNRCRCRNNENNQVLGVSRIPEIALRGPGCISGTGLCDGVLGTGGVSCEELLALVQKRCGNVLGTGGGCCSNVLGTGERRCNNVLGNSGQNNGCDNVMGSGSRRRNKPCCCEWIWSYLETPTIVPR